MLGALLALAGDETTVILMSDHGFHPDHLRPQHIPNEPAGPADEHRHLGVFVMKGPGIRGDERVFGATLLDVTPTILTLFGLPVGEDMDGKVIAGAFEHPPEVETVPSWDEVEGDAGMHPAGSRLDPIESQAVLKQMIDLGYIEEPSADRQEAADKIVRELRHNLARDYMGANLYAEAVEIYQKLWDQWPDQHRFGVQLIQCYLAMEWVARRAPFSSNSRGTSRRTRLRQLRN